MSKYLKRLTSLFGDEDQLFVVSWCHGRVGGWVVLLILVEDFDDHWKIIEG